MANEVGFFQIQGKDGKGLTSFYKKHFGWKMSPTPNGDGGQMVARETDGIPGVIGPTMDGSAKSLAVYVTVKDIKKHLAQIAKGGGKVAMPPMQLPGGMGSIAGFTDPAGNWVGLWQAGKGAAAAPKKAAKKKAAKKTAKRSAKKPAKKAAKKKPAKRARKA